MRFTRYLYEVGDVKNSLIMAILKKKIDETLFWTGELYHSGLNAEVWHLLFTIYYEFYYVTNARMETQLLKLKKKDDIFTFAKSLCNLNRQTTFVFELNKLTELDDINVDYIYKTTTGTIPNLKRSIQCEHIKNIAFYIKKVSLSDEIFKQAQEIISDSLNVKLPHITENLSKLILISRISKSIYLKRFKSLKIIKPQISVMTEEEIETQKDINTINGSLHTILERKRKYGVENTGLELLGYNTDMDEKQHNMWFNWEYYAYQVPLWKKRIEQYKGKPSSTEIIFPDEESAEDFYQKYSFEPDEQKTETNRKAINTIDCIDYLKWREDIIKLK